MGSDFSFTRSTLDLVDLLYFRGSWFRIVTEYLVPTTGTSYSHPKQRRDVLKVLRSIPSRPTVFVRRSTLSSSFLLFTSSFMKKRTHLRMLNLREIQNQEELVAVP